MIERPCGSEGRIDTSPEEDQDRTDNVDQHSQPIPAVGIHDNVGVTGDNGSGGNQNTHTSSVVDVQTVCGDEIRGLIQQIRHVVADDRLIETVTHIQPEAC